VPLVCRAWRQQVNSSPQLLRSMQLELGSQRQPAHARLQSFLEWMLRYSISHVRSLDLEIFEYNDGACPTAVVEGLSALLGACGAAGSLEELHVRHNVPATARCWLSGMRRLRKLSPIP